LENIMRRRWLLLLAFAPASLSAQMLDVQPGARVRVMVPSLLAGKVEAIVSARHGDSVTVLTSAPAQVSFPLSSATSLEVSTGRSHLHGAKKGLIWGVGIGVGFAVATMFDSTMTTAADNKTQISKGEYVGTMTFGGAMIGAVIGAFIGSERWNSYTFPTRVSVGRSGASVGTTLHF
jgi:hypothetical protein